MRIYLKVFVCFIVLLILDAVAFSILRDSLLPSGFFEWTPLLESHIYSAYKIYGVFLSIYFLLVLKYLKSSKRLTVSLLVFLWLSFPTIGTWRIEPVEPIQPSCQSITLVSPLILNIHHTIIGVHHYSRRAGICGVDLSGVPSVIITHIEVLTLYLGTLLYCAIVKTVQRYSRVFYDLNIFEVQVAKKTIINWAIALGWLVILGLFA